MASSVSQPALAMHRGFWAGLLCAGSVSFIPGCGESALTLPTIADDTNLPPRIAAPALYADHDLHYSGTIVVWDQDGDSVTVNAVTLPQWLAFDSAALLLTGVPGEENLGVHRVELVASDGKTTTTLAFDITVKVGVSSLIFEGWWVEIGLYPFGHDGHPCVSENFVVYSGFSAFDERERAASVLEAHFAALMDTLSVESTDEYVYVTEDRKLHIFLSKYQHTLNWWGAHRRGFVYASRDSPYNNLPPGAYDFTLLHELMHVVQFMLIGWWRDGMPGAWDVWFVEGVAEYVSDAPDFEQHQPNVTTYSGLRDWVKSHGNPVSFRDWTDYPPDLQESGFVAGYYPYFEVAFRYLVDADGYGKTMSDVKNLFLDQRNGMSFHEAFENRMGMTVDEYEASFMSRMAEYLEN